MELCELCQQIDIWKWIKQDNEDRDPDLPDWMEAGSIEHHRNYANLRQSASQGCRLCILLKHALLDSMRDRAAQGFTDWQSSTVEKYLLDERDFLPERFFIEPRYYKPGDGFGFMADVPLLRGFHYMKPKKHSPLYPGPFLSFKTYYGNAHDQIASRSNGSRSDINLANEWLRCCISEHPECTQLGGNSIPTRLIDCESGWSGQTVRIVENVGSGPYIALSHCWGSIQPLRTTIRNYKEHLMGISFARLPASFQDAALATRSFGVRYLWIDSLCIVQDSPEDWERECSRMAEVYANALLTFAASDALDSTAGFLKDYIRHTAIAVTTLRLRNQDQALTEDLIVEYASPSVKGKDDGESHLTSRGWALQERLLAPRTLSFHKDRLRWDCNRYSRSDDLRHAFRVNRMVYNVVEKRNIRQLNDAEGLFNHWCEIIDTYSACKLTKSADKLPAVSGLAQLFSTMLGDSYLAGLWSGDIHVGLSWYYHGLTDYEEERDVDEKTAAERCTYRAPSWSWASIDSKFTFRASSRGHKKDLVLISGRTVLKGLDQFGQVTDGALHVNGRLKECTVRAVSTESFCIFESNLPKVRDINPLAKVYLDSPQTRRRLRGDSSEEMQDVMAVLISLNPGGYSKWIALALVRAAHKLGAFRRVGLIVCHSPQTAGHDWFDDARRESIVIV